MEKTGRLAREERTVAALIDCYCSNHHGTRGELCAECRELLEYCRARLSRCPFKGDKPVCSDCRVHCYRPEMRARVKAVMRYSGPRLPLRHPWLALMHLLDGWRKNKRLRH